MVSSDRVYNFSAGPSMMPVEVLDKAASEMSNWGNSGMGVMEMSHRSKQFVEIYNQCEKDYRDVLNMPDHFKFMALQGGATAQFAAVPLNMYGWAAQNGRTVADYLVTGQWGDKAIKEADKYGATNLACNTKPTKYTSITDPSEWKLTDNAAYVHYCQNETVNGVEWKYVPEVAEGTPLVADMSSNFLSRPVDWDKHAAIYVGAQKNCGPAGVTLVFAEEKYMGHSLKACPTVLDWKTFSDAGSMYNTPPCYSIYMLGLYIKYTKEVGGIAYWNELADKKSGMIYDIIDGSDGFYSAPVNPDCRSRMNVPFTIKGDDAELTAKFLEEAKKQGLTTLAGHRSVGGCRASLYNGMPLAGVEKLAQFMKSFQTENP